MHVVLAGFRYSLLVAWLVAFSSAFITPAQAQNAARIALVQPEDDFPVSVPDRYASDEYYLSVPENRSNADSRHIKLPVVILRGDVSNSRPPVVMLTGGPGTSGLSAAMYPGAYPWVGDRDFIVLGQRGTHHSRPALMCPQYSQSQRDGASEQEEAASVADCARVERERGVDLSAYNTAESARDLEDLRKMLGAQRFVLYGLSYGTRLALSYARQYPDRVEALVLDSPLPFGADYDSEFPSNVESVLQSMAERCSGQPDCAARYPDLWSRFSVAMARIAQSDTTAAIPIAGQIALIITPGSADDIANAPKLMDAAANLQFDLFPLDQGRGEPSDFAWGMRLSVWCSERHSPQIDVHDAVPIPFANIDAPTFPAAICDAWNVPSRPAVELVDPTGDYPVLVLAGQYDVLTPPHWGKQLVDNFKNGRLVTIPAGLHGVTTNWGGTGCGMAVAADFIDSPLEFLAGPLELDCVALEPHPKFILDAPGTASQASNTERQGGSGY